MDLEDENDIQTDHVDLELPEDPLMLFQQLESPDAKSATAEAAPAAQSSSPEPRAATAEVDPDDEFVKFRAYLQENVPHWTVEPEFENWWTLQTRKGPWRSTHKERSNW